MKLDGQVIELVDLFDLIGQTSQMTELPVSEAKAHFSDVLRQVAAGEEIIVTRGVRKEAVAAIIPIEKYRMQKQRTLGALQHWGTITIEESWVMTEEDLLSS